MGNLSCRFLQWRPPHIFQYAANSTDRLSVYDFVFGTVTAKSVLFSIRVGEKTGFAHCHRRVWQLQLQTCRSGKPVSLDKYQMPLIKGTYDEWGWNIICRDKNKSFEFDVFCNCPCLKLWRKLILKILQMFTPPKLQLINHPFYTKVSSSKKKATW